jgi:hypothetical protein
MVRILTNETPTEELQRKFTEELEGMLKKAAVKFKCNVEELKYRTNNAGVVEIERMNAQEMIDMVAFEAEQKMVITIKKSRGVL